MNAPLVTHDPNYQPLEVVSKGGAAVFGVVRPLKEIRTSLNGRIRLRLRNDDFAFAFVRDHSGLRKFAVIDFGDHWQLGIEQSGRNLTLDE